MWKDDRGRTEEEREALSSDTLDDTEDDKFRSDFRALSIGR